MYIYQNIIQFLVEKYDAKYLEICLDLILFRLLFKFFFWGSTPIPPVKARALRALAKRLAALALIFSAIFLWGVGNTDLDRVCDK